MNRNYLDLVILAILIVFGVYELYKGVRQKMNVFKPIKENIPFMRNINYGSPYI